MTAHDLEDNANAVLSIVRGHRPRLQGESQGNSLLPVFVGVTAAGPLILPLSRRALDWTMCIDRSRAHIARHFVGVNVRHAIRPGSLPGRVVDDDHMLVPGKSVGMPAPVCKGNTQ